MARPRRGNRLRTSAVKEQGELDAHAEVTGTLCQVEVLGIGFGVAQIARAPAPGWIGVRRCGTRPQPDHIYAMMFQDLEHILDLPGIVPPRHAIVLVRQFLFFEERVVDATEERRTQEPLLGLRGSARRGSYVQIGAGGSSTPGNIQEQAGALTCDRVVTARSGRQRPLLAGGAIAGILDGPGCTIARSGVEAKPTRQIADFPTPTRQARECPALAQIGKAARLLNDMIAGSHRVVDQVRLEPAELIENVVDLAIDGRDIGRLGRRIRLAAATPAASTSAPAAGVQRRTSAAGSEKQCQR